MNKHTWLLRAGLSLIAGILFYAYFQEWIIIRWPQTTATRSPKATPADNKKKVVLHYWHRDTWHQEIQELVTPADLSESLHFLVNTWLTLLHQEEVMHKKVYLQAALVSPS